jgi:hypothetical protein
MRDKDELRAELKGIQKALDEVKAEYDEGAIDTGRYLKLKKKYEADKEKLEQELRPQEEPESLPRETMPVNQNIKLDNELRIELIDLLSKHPKLATRDDRDVWLYNLPQNVQDMITRRSDHRGNDLAFIIEAIKLVQLTDGQWPILILIDALLSKMEGLESGTKLKALREKMIEGQPVKEQFLPAKAQQDKIVEDRALEQHHIPEQPVIELRGNPFISRMPVRGKFFFGRANLIKKIFQCVEKGQSVSLVGEQRSGKTSILLRLRDVKEQYLAPPEQHALIFLDFSGLDYHNERDIWLTLLTALSQELNHASLELPLTQAIEQLKSGKPIPLTLQTFFRSLAQEVRTTFLFDEFDVIADKNRPVDSDFCKHLRTLVNDPETHIVYVIATRQQLDEVENCLYGTDGPPHSPLFNIFKKLPVPVFYKKDAEQMVKYLLEDAGVNRQAIRTFWSQSDFLFQMSGFHPFFLQVVCYHLFEHTINTLDGTSAEQVPKEVTLDFYDEALAHFEYYWRVSSEDEKELLCELCAGPSDADELAHRSTFVSLRNRCLVVRVGRSKWQLFSDVFARWIQDEMCVNGN